MLDLWAQVSSGAGGTDTEQSKQCELGTWHMVSSSPCQALRKQCYPQEQQGAGTVCSSSATCELATCRSPLIALSRISSSTVGLPWKCHFRALIDALQQTKVSRRKKRLRKLKKDDKICQCNRSFLPAECEEHAGRVVRCAGVISGAVPTYCQTRGFILL